MSTTANFAATPRAALALISAANTARDGSGTMVTVFTAGGSGSRVDDYDLVSIAATTAGVVRLFIHDGTNARLWREYIVPAITPSTATAVWSLRVTDAGLILPTSYSLRASTHNAESFVVAVTRAGDF